MSMPPPRLEVTIDIFEEKEQRASIMAQLTGRELIESILQEFSSLEYLSGRSADYSLIRALDGTALDVDMPLTQQIKPKERLALVEGEAPLPEGAQRPTRHAYLRDDATAVVYKLHWWPAIIGRSDTTLPLNDLLVVDLGGQINGQSVSRRHAQIIEENGRFFIKSLSQNPTTLIDGEGQKTPLTEELFPLDSGQSVSLDQSEIVLKFIVRDEAVEL